MQTLPDVAATASGDVASQCQWVRVRPKCAVVDSCPADGVSWCRDLSRRGLPSTGVQSLGGWGRPSLRLSVPVEPVVVMLSSVEQVPFSSSRASSAQVRVRVDLHEHERRDAGGLGAVTNQRLLDALMSLPMGLGVSVDAVDEDSRQVVRRAPAGVVDEVDGEFVRLARRPVVIESVLATARSWRAAQASISCFAAHCERTVRLPLVEVDPLLRVEAEHLGVGIESIDGELLVEPRPFVARRFTSYGWWFTEVLYEQWMATRR